MVRVEIPGHGVLELEHLVLDVNGTIAHDGVVVPGVAEGLTAVRGTLRVVAVTADTHGTAGRLRDELGVEVRVIAPGNEAAQKRELVEALGASRVIAVGNGANDVEMVQAAAVGVCVIGGEGAAVSVLTAADVVVGGIADLFGLLEHPGRLAATLRR